MTRSLKQLPLFDVHQRMGARLEPFHGWAVPARFRAPQEEAQTARQSVGLGDWSWMAKFDLKGLGLKTPSEMGPLAACWPLGVRHYLITCEPAVQDVVMERIRLLEQAMPPAVCCTPVTSVYADFRLAGSRSRDVLAKLTSLDVSERRMPNYGCGQAALAEVHAIILRQDLGVMPAFHILVGRDYAESVWHAVLEAGEEFSIGLFGSEAHPLLEAQAG